MKRKKNSPKGQTCTHYINLNLIKFLSEGIIMRNSNMKKRIASAAAAAVMSFTAVAGTFGGTNVIIKDNNTFTAVAAESTVKFNQAVGYAEAMYATWASVSGASGYISLLAPSSSIEHIIPHDSIPLNLPFLILIPSGYSLLSP